MPCSHQGWNGNKMQDEDQELLLSDLDNDFEDDDEEFDDDEPAELDEDLGPSLAETIAGEDTDVTRVSRRVLNPKYATKEELSLLREELSKLHSKVILNERKKEDSEIFWIYTTDGAKAPTRAHEYDAGWDVYANADFVVMHETKPTVVTTGLYLQVPNGWEVQVRPRSGLALKEGVTVANSPGTIDAGYTGEVKVGLVNNTSEAYEVKAGQRIAQLVFKRLPAVELINTSVSKEGEDPIFSSLEEFQEHQKSSRGKNGFGSTGMC